MSAPASAERRRHAALSQAYRAACRLELRALKPGNVHVHGEGHGMTVAQFRASARAAAEPLCRAGCSVGNRLEDAVTDRGFLGAFLAAF